MKTNHRIVFEDSQNMRAIPSQTVDLLVTSPPYPMIEMWDGNFVKQNRVIAEFISQGKGKAAFEQMHECLDGVWDESYRVLKEGGIACINVGDATRTVDNAFMLFPNHARISTRMQHIGFTPLPVILWRKQTNAPNKFMGSGMLPPGAYVTLEHEFILIFRKGRKREFKKDTEKLKRRESAYFWEERNVCFSDIWLDLKGIGQDLGRNSARSRSAAYPFDLPYRLINMFSIKGDMVVDPFLGLGTTMHAAMAAGRNCMGYEVDKSMEEFISSGMIGLHNALNRIIKKRLENHVAYVLQQRQIKNFKYISKHYRFPVMTRQETDILINPLQSVQRLAGYDFEVVYDDVL
ncbi:DNA-methyltransferase [Thermodesulfobacteriota bacterium]